MKGPHFDIDITEAMPPRCFMTVSVKVTGLWRLKVAGLLFRFGAWVLGTEVELRFSDDEDQD